MKFPNQSRPVARQKSAGKDASAGVLPSDCCGPGKCCLGACLPFVGCAGVCVPNLGQC